MRFMYNPVVGDLLTGYRVFKIKGEEKCMKPSSRYSVMSSNPIFGCGLIKWLDLPKLPVYNLSDVSMVFPYPSSETLPIMNTMEIPGLISGLTWVEFSRH